jgi:hypothetical protein
MKVSEIIVLEQVGMYYSCDEWEEALEEFIADRFKVDGIQAAAEKGQIKLRGEKKSAETGLVLKCTDASDDVLAEFNFSDAKGWVGA